MGLQLGITVNRSAVYLPLYTFTVPRYGRYTVRRAGSHSRGQKKLFKTLVHRTKCLDIFTCSTDALFFLNLYRSTYYFMMDCHFLLGHQIFSTLNVLSSYVISSKKKNTQLMPDTHPFST